MCRLMFEVLQALYLSVVFSLFVFNLQYVSAGVCVHVHVCVCAMEKQRFIMCCLVFDVMEGLLGLFTHPPTPSLPFSLCHSLSFYSFLSPALLCLHFLAHFPPTPSLSSPTTSLPLSPSQRPEVFESIDSCGSGCCCCYTPSMDGHEYFIWGKGGRD